MSLLTLEVDGAVLVDVDLVDHVLELAIGGVQTEGTHDCPELVLGDLTCETHLISSHSVRPPRAYTENLLVSSTRFEMADKD